MAGVVSHPVSELGKQGVSPATASNGNAKSPNGDTKAELACFLARETLLVNQIASNGIIRYHE